MNASRVQKNVGKVAGFDDEIDYYVYEYVYDTITDEYTEYEGEVVDIVKASNSVYALEKLGLDDFNRYGAKPIEDLDAFQDAIKQERKKLTKLNKTIGELTSERDAERKKYLEENLCPNCDIKMDKKRRCDKCGYGFEQEKLLEEIESGLEE